MADNNIFVSLYTLQLRGNLAYEYNPFHNYLTEYDLYEVDTDVGKVYVPKGYAVNKRNGIILTYKNRKWVDKKGNIHNEKDIYEPKNSDLYAKKGSLIDLETDKLNFDIDHPVDITVLPSYDGSVNLILNDDKNIPRLINSRFSVREKNTYEIVDRIGENDTNVYNSKAFDKDSSLYFQFDYNPIVYYQNFVRGVLPVGQYCFYFTYCDADDNESDFVAETGVIPVFIGEDSNPYSMDGGIKNQSSNKGIKLRLENMDKSYNYIKVYYVRYLADYGLNRTYECKKIVLKYPVNSSILFIQITGNEETEDLDANILNITRFNPKSILTQAQCKNMLFFGNIVKNTDNYKELQDCALKIVPEITSDTINSTDYDYNGDGYYNSLNIYNKVGYFDLEYYRFGVVFIYKNGTLSNVYNTLGKTLTREPFEYELNLIYENSNEAILKRRYIEIDDYGWIKNGEKFFKKDSISGANLNSKGVCKIDYGISDNSTILGIKFNIPEEVYQFLKEDLNIRGLFFVRQKCVPNILALCYLMPMDELLEAPVIKINDKYKTECFVSLSKRVDGDGQAIITQDYNDRLYTYNDEAKISGNAYAAICPDFLLNQPYYNQIFNGGKFRIKRITSNSELILSNNRIYNTGNLSYTNTGETHPVDICSVTEDVPSIAIKNKVYKLNMGVAEEAYRFKYADVDNSLTNIGDDDQTSKVNNATNIVRGTYSPYLAIYSESKLLTNVYYNIYTNEFLSELLEYLNRMNSSEPFYAISDRYNFETLNKSSNNKFLNCWKGDCYINTFTYRLNRNFNDPSLPNNDKIIDHNTWKHYNIDHPEEFSDISRSDINAILLGSWITLKVRSATNYALRSIDHSYVSEEALMGAPRSFYPRSFLLYRGENKMPDSYLYNDAYRASLGFKCYFTLKDVNYIKDTFSNRIQYSAIAILDSYKNNYRESLSTYFRDYSQEYGSITKLVGFEGYLLVIFEHAIGVAVINERVLVGNGDGEPVFINTKNVLPEELTIITDTYGSLWTESIIKSEAGYVYGVDTVAKKIWRVKGQQLEIISDFKVNEFLVNNITLGERELNPIIGLKNVKTHYNNNKKDIMFTFYDDIYKDEEKVWNLCYNELVEQFITFYSWLPSYSENIDTLYFSFDRNTSKGLSLLNKCNYNIEENTGVLLDSPIISYLNGEFGTANVYYYTPEIIQSIDYGDSDHTDYKHKYRFKFNLVTFELEPDHWGNYKLFDSNKIKEGILKINNSEKALNAFKKLKILYLEITPKLSSLNNLSANTNYSLYFKTETIAITLNTILNNYNLIDSTWPNLTTNFYLHGQSGLFNFKETLKPTYWYDEQHPFEFEFVVNDKIGLLKIFNNLVIISNKAEPESFHFEIEGDNYEFSSDKRTMYFRQEATKNLYLNLGSNIIYDRYYGDVATTNYEQYYRGDGVNPTTKEYNKYNTYPVENTGLVKQVKSTIFPLYYERIDTFNDIYDKYLLMTGGGYDFKNLSGSEIKWNKRQNLFNIVTHIKNSPMNRNGILRGNSMYNEGKWEIQIPSISFMLKNEKNWILNNGLNNNLLEIPPIVINSSYIPKDVTDLVISLDKLPNIYLNTGYNVPYIIDLDWTYRKETKIRDKWIKIKIRYSGKNLAIIHSLITLYDISYG